MNLTNEKIRQAINKHRKKAGHYFCNGWILVPGGTNNKYEKCQSFEDDVKNGINKTKKHL